MVTEVKTKETKRAVVGKKGKVDTSKLTRRERNSLVKSVSKNTSFDNMSNAEKFSIDILQSIESRENLRSKIKGFTISNDIVQDELSMPMVVKEVYREFGENYIPQREAFITAKNFLLYAARENLREQKFAETAKSVYTSLITNPYAFHASTSPLVARCDEVVFENGVCTMRGNVVLVDGATRGLLFEEMRRYAGGIFDEILEKTIVPITIQVRSDFYDIIDLQLNSANRNTSTPVDPYNVAQGAGVFEELYKYAGRFKELINVKTSGKGDKTVINGKYIGKRFNDDLISLSPYFAHSSINEDCSEYGAKTTLSAVAKNVVSLLKSGDNDAGKNYFSHMKSVVEECYSISEFLDFYFLPRVAEIAPEYFEYFVSKLPDENGIIQPDLKSSEFSLDGKNTQKIYYWNKTARRGIITVLRNLYKEENGEVSFICDPIKILNSDMFIMGIAPIMAAYMTVSLVKEDKDKDKKGTSTEVRSNKNCKALYNMGGKIVSSAIRVIGA